MRWMRVPSTSKCITAERSECCHDFSSASKSLTEVPRSTLTDDYAMLGNLAARPFGSPHDMLDVWIDEFDVLYRESKHAARMFSVNWHHCMMGRPAISKALDRLLTHVNKHEGLWFARGRVVAEFWLKHRGKQGAASL